MHEYISSADKGGKSNTWQNKLANGKIMQDKQIMQGNVFKQAIESDVLFPTVEGLSIPF